MEIHDARFTMSFLLHNIMPCWKSEQMRAAVGKNDWKGYGIVAHSVKGLMASLGLKDLSEKSQKHEKAAETADTEYILSDYEAFIEAYRNVCSKMR